MLDAKVESRMQLNSVRLQLVELFRSLNSRKTRSSQNNIKRENRRYKR